MNKKPKKKKGVLKTPKKVDIPEGKASFGDVIKKLFEVKPPKK